VTVWVEAEAVPAPAPLVVDFPAPPLAPAPPLVFELDGPEELPLVGDELPEPADPVLPVVPGVEVGVGTEDAAEESSLARADSAVETAAWSLETWLWASMAVVRAVVQAWLGLDAPVPDVIVVEVDVGGGIGGDVVDVVVEVPPPVVEVVVAEQVVSAVARSAAATWLSLSAFCWASTTAFWAACRAALPPDAEAAVRVMTSVPVLASVPGLADVVAAGDPGAE
jgi:hypothetical protein